MSGGELKTRLETCSARAVVEARSLPVGFGLAGLEVRLADGRRLAVKARRRRERQAESRARGLHARRACASVGTSGPARASCRADLLVMDFIENDGGGITPSVERHAAELIAKAPCDAARTVRLRARHADRAAAQPNPQASALGAVLPRPPPALHGAQAQREGPCRRDARRIERLAERIDDYLIEPAFPSLLHGDLWTGNVLVRGGRIAGFVDPAIYCGSPEIELAFATLFGTFGAGILRGI